MSAHTTATDAHPDFCHIEFCNNEYPSDVEHRVRPDLWATAAEMAVSIGMTRDDELGIPWRTGVRLQLESLAFETRSGDPLECDAYLTITEAETLGMQLLAHAARARRTAMQVGVL